MTQDRGAALEVFLFRLGSVLLALVLTSLVLLLVDTSPLEAFSLILRGALGSPRKVADIFVIWIPLLLTSAGLLFTFHAGLWNIGIEGQIVLGAIAATWVLRLVQDTATPPALALVLAFVAAALGGMLWALISGVLKVYGGVNEIFSGLGLDFVAITLVLYLVFGPWKRPGVASMSGTEPFPRELWLPTLEKTRLSPWALGLALVVWLLTIVLLQRSYLGLRLRAVGRNPRAAYLMLGLSPARLILLAFALSGAMAGLAGAVQVTAVYHRLLPAISSGYGWLGLLVGMLVNYSPLWIGPVAWFFALLNLGSIQLPIVLKVDSTLAGVLQGTLVYSFLLGEGLRRVWQQRRQRQQPQPVPSVERAPSPE